MNNIQKRRTAQEELTPYGWCRRCKKVPIPEHNYKHQADYCDDCLRAIYG